MASGLVGDHRHAELGHGRQSLLEWRLWVGVLGAHLQQLNEHHVGAWRALLKDEQNERSAVAGGRVEGPKTLPVA